MIDFRLLGTVGLTDASGREVKSLLTRSRRLALLAYLAVATPRGLRRRDTLLALFWPELDQEHARAALRQALHVVRDALGAEVIVTRGDDEVGLDLERIWCDVVAFDEAIATDQCGAALDLYHGDLLEGFFIPGAGEFERWLESTRGQLRAAASSAAKALVEQCETTGDVGAAVEWARRSVRLGLYDEEILRRLIALLDRLGDRAGAVQAYEEFAQQLRTDLETEPSAETKAVLAEVQARTTAIPLNVRRATAVAALSRRRSQWWPVVLAATAAGLMLSSGGAGRGGVAARCSPRTIAGRAPVREPLR
jgi:serine/threonine-protein kinase